MNHHALWLDSVANDYDPEWIYHKVKSDKINKWEKESIDNNVQQTTVVFVNRNVERSESYGICLYVWNCMKRVRLYATVSNTQQIHCILCCYAVVCVYVERLCLSLCVYDEKIKDGGVRNIERREKTS